MQKVPFGTGLDVVQETCRRRSRSRPAISAGRNRSRSWRNCRRKSGLTRKRSHALSTHLDEFDPEVLRQFKRQIVPFVNISIDDFLDCFGSNKCHATSTGQQRHRQEPALSRGHRAQSVDLRMDDPWPTVFSFGPVDLDAGGRAIVSKANGVVLENSASTDLHVGILRPALGDRFREDQRGFFPGLSLARFHHQAYCRLKLNSRFTNFKIVPS
jgi:hypothetical protein